MTVSEQRIITAILPDDVDTIELADRLKDEFAILATFRHSARGVGRSTRRLGRAPLIPERRNVFFVIIDESRAEPVFRWLLEAAQVDRYGGGLVFERRLGRTWIPAEDA